MLSWCVEAAQWVYDVIRRHLPMWKPGSVAQTVACLTEESDSISGLAFAFVEIDHEILSSVIFSQSLKDKCQLLVWVLSTG